MSNLVIKLDIDKLSKSDKSNFDKILANDSFKRFILKRSDSSVIVAPPLFDYLEYEIYSKSSYRKKVLVSLFQKDPKTSKYSLLVNQCRPGSTEYHKILRVTRLERVS